MLQLPSEFVERMERSLGENFGKFIETYKESPARAVRVNTLKISAEEFGKISPLALDGKVPWEPSGYFVRGERLGRTVEHAAGLYYVQEPSAMSPVPALRVREGERVLDLCSAPGGKGTQIAQYLNGSGIAFLNEIDFARAKILSENVERLGVKNAVITCASPEALAGEFVGYFDKILVDAPCSGEGMFKKEELAVREWSLENVAASAERQARILCAADKMLSVGGTLVYSTCTFSEEEDEAQIEKFLANRPYYELSEMKKLLPHEVRGEGQFYAVLKKTDGGRNSLPLLRPVADGQTVKAYGSWVQDTVKKNFANLHTAAGVLYSVPEGMPKIGAQILRAGVRLGAEKNGRFEPSHSLAMSLKCYEADCISLDYETALKYLRGLTFDCPPSERGWKVAAYNGYPLGWCKLTGGTAKNHLPKGLRI